MEGKGVCAVVLAAGYGTRLERDLRQDSSGKYGHLLGLPKALVPVGGKPLVDYWLEAFERTGVSPVYVVSNAHHYDHFKRWAEARGFPLDSIFNDGSQRNEERKGAIGALHMVMKAKEIHGDMLVVAGDTLFDVDFKLEDVLHHFKSLASGESLITYYEIKDRQEVTKRGIIEVDDTNKVTKFLEKPKLEETDSNKACPPLYIYSGAIESLIHQYVEEAQGNLSLIDAPGSLVAWLAARTTVRGHRLPGRFDIGSLADYITADAYFTKANASPDS